MTTHVRSYIYKKSEESLWVMNSVTERKGFLILKIERYFPTVVPWTGHVINCSYWKINAIPSSHVIGFEPIKTSDLQCFWSNCNYSLLIFSVILNFISYYKYLPRGYLKTFLLSDSDFLIVRKGWEFLNTKFHCSFYCFNMKD